MDLKEIQEKFERMTPEQKQEQINALQNHLKKKPFVPNPGPQTEAYYTKADWLLYGGCVSGETEYLTSDGWKRIDQYSGEEIASWQDGVIDFVKPEYTDVPCDELIHFSSSRMSMMLSPMHRMPLYKYDGEFVVKNAIDVERNPSRHKVPVNFSVENNGIAISDDMLRLAVAIHADGNLYVKKDNSAYCRISVRKQRKKDRIIWLLSILGIKFKEYHNKNRPTEVRYSFVSPINTKDFSGFWWGASQRQLEIILDEMSYWDGLISGTKGGDIEYNSKNKIDADFMQYAAHACGRVACIGVRKKRKEHHSDMYRVTISREGSVKSSVVLRIDSGKIERVKRDRMYCFTVPSTFWIARHNDCIFVTGNSPGGGKSTLGLGLALNEHKRSLVLRKNFSDLEGIIDTCKKLVGNKDGFVGGTRPKYNKPDGGVIHFAGVAEDGGIGGHQGVDHDLIYVDECAQFSENQIRLIQGWLRTDNPEQRTRIVLGSNPPLDSTGDWMIKFFAPWFDKGHPNPAKPGELRWYLPNEEGDDIECNEGEFATINGLRVPAYSRTFIPSKVTDNPYYDAEDYAKQLVSLPKEVREILMSGSFMIDRPEGLWQLIPREWVKQAMERWHTHRPVNIPMSAVGVDVAQGGGDDAVIARRYDGWFDKIVTIRGKDVPEGSDLAGQVMKYRRDNASVIIDMGGGYGGAVKLHLENNGIKCVPYKGTKGSTKTVKGTGGKGKPIGFPNTRSEAYWNLRGLLDPDQPGGSRICLPDDQRLLSEICTPEYRYNGNKYHVETKEQVVSRLGRSTDYADAVVMALYAGPLNVTSSHPGQSVRDIHNKTPKVIMGHERQRRPRR